MPVITQQPTSHRKEHYQCPECGTARPFELYECINAMTDPELRGAIADKSLFVQQCDICGHRTETLYPLLYIGADERQVVYYIATADREQQQAAGEVIQMMNDEIVRAVEAGDGGLSVSGCEFRVVATYPELAEKLYAHELGLDDRILELTKLYYLDKLRGQAPLEDLTGFFLARDGDAPAFAIIFTSEGGEVTEGASAFHRAVYDGLAEKFAQRVGDEGIVGFRVVDQGWAMGILPRLSGVLEGEVPEPEPCACHH
jgi:hypothetical protein